MRKSNIVTFLLAALVTGATLAPSIASATNTFPASMCTSMAGSAQALAGGAPDIRTDARGDLVNDLTGTSFNYIDVACPLINPPSGAAVKVQGAANGNNFNSVKVCYTDASSSGSIIVGACPSATAISTNTYYGVTAPVATGGTSNSYYYLDVAMSMPDSLGHNTALFGYSVGL